jgi:hypothetical protein
MTTASTGWRIDPETLRLINPDLPDNGDRATSTKEQFGAQQWPPCPVCGATVEVDLIDVTLNEEDLRRNGRSYIAARWDCPRDCDQITKQRRHLSQQWGRDAASEIYFSCSCGISAGGISLEEFERLREEHRLESDRRR